MDNVRTRKTRVLGDACTQWTWVLQRLFVQVQKAERSNLPGLWRRMRRRRTCVLSLHNLHGGASPTTTENWDTLRDRDTGRSHVARTGNLERDCMSEAHRRGHARRSRAAIDDRRTI